MGIVCSAPDTSLWLPWLDGTRGPFLSLLLSSRTPLIVCVSTRNELVCNSRLRLPILEVIKGTLLWDLYLRKHRAQRRSTVSIPIVVLDLDEEQFLKEICLEICYEPSTTTCGHSHTVSVRSAADKCGKRCPKCMQLISNGTSCTVNTFFGTLFSFCFPRS
ncbi:hypothetical protein EZV62_015286 [Acer yangbiense]|uniref:RING-type E3 ubiquitin transferase n=1 Tax=Acer yangbiense TaxID=1000413 RepID=A0A5C7HK96_9ROSI|nr:hypothetical protein EZV62_015286 [Acer yangbiense]